MSGADWDSFFQQHGSEQVDLSSLTEEQVLEFFDKSGLPKDKVDTLLADLTSVLNKAEDNRRRLAKVLQIVSGIGEFGLKVVKAVI